MQLSTGFTALPREPPNLFPPIPRYAPHSVPFSVSPCVLPLSVFMPHRWRRASSFITSVCSVMATGTCAAERVVAASRRPLRGDRLCVFGLVLCLFIRCVSAPFPLPLPSPFCCPSCLGPPPEFSRIPDLPSTRHRSFAFCGSTLEKWTLLSCCAPMSAWGCHSSILQDPFKFRITCSTSTNGWYARVCWPRARFVGFVGTLLLCK